MNYELRITDYRTIPTYQSGIAAKLRQGKQDHPYLTVGDRR